MAAKARNGTNAVSPENIVILMKRRRTGSVSLVFLAGGLAIQDAPVCSTDNDEDVVCAADRRANCINLFIGSFGYYSKLESNRK